MKTYLLDRKDLANHRAILLEALKAIRSTPLPNSQARLDILTICSQAIKKVTE